MSTGVRLDDVSIEAVARRVAELLGRELATEGLVDASEIARRFGVSTDYVYRHANDLGSVRLGDGPKARLRFDPAEVAERLGSIVKRESFTPKRTNRVAVRNARSVGLLPGKGELS